MGSQPRLVNWVKAQNGLPNANLHYDLVGEKMATPKTGEGSM